MPQHHSELDAGDDRLTRPLAMAATVCAVLVTAILPAVTQLRSPAHAADQPGPVFNTGYQPDPAVYSGSGFLTGIGPCAFLGGRLDDGNGLEPAPAGLALVGNWPHGRAFGGIHAAPCEIPAPIYAIAHDAPVIVTLGGDQPIQLGAQRNDDGTRILHVWNWSQSRLSRPLRVKQDVRPAAVSPDGKWLITSEGQKIDVATGAVEPIEPPFPEGVQKVRFSPDGRTLALWVVPPDGAASVRLLDFPTCTPRCEIPEVFRDMFAVAFTADGNELILMDKERLIRRWDALTGVVLQKFEVPHVNTVRALAVSSDGRWVASAAEGEIFLWDAPTGKLRHRLGYETNLGPSLVFSLQFSPDGERLAGGGFLHLVLWNCESGAQERMLPTPMWATRIRFQDEGRRITTVSGTHGILTETREGVMGYPWVQHWDVETGEEVAVATAEELAKEQKLQALIDKVLAAHGGEDRLNRLQSFTMTVNHSNGETQHYFVQPPNNFRWETTHRDSTGKRIVILFPEGRRWWTQEPGEDAREFIPTGAEPTVEFWLDYVKFFGPRQVLRLKDADHKVALLDEEARIGDRAAEGVEVTGPHFKGTMYFDRETHLVLRTGVGANLREVTCSDYKTFDGIPIARKEHDGYFEPEVTDFRIVEKFDAGLFDQP